jgi:hypothetical protein
MIAVLSVLVSFFAKTRKKAIQPYFPVIEALGFIQLQRRIHQWH